MISVNANEYWNINRSQMNKNITSKYPNGATIEASSYLNAKLLNDTKFFKVIKIKFFIVLQRIQKCLHKWSMSSLESWSYWSGRTQEI